jgi:hypothetical protein
VASRLRRARTSHACDRWTVSRTRQAGPLKIKPLIARVTQSVVMRRQILLRPTSTRRREHPQFQRLAPVGMASIHRHRFRI